MKMAMTKLLLSSLGGIGAVARASGADKQLVQAAMAVHHLYLGTPAAAILILSCTCSNIVIIRAPQWCFYCYLV